MFSVSQLLDEEKSQLAKQCGYSPYALCLTISYLQNTNISVTSFLSMSPATPDTPVSPTIEFAMLYLFKDDKVKDILNSFFRSFEHKWQKKFMELSLFEDKFDTKAARAVMGDHDFQDSTRNLQYFEVRNLIEVSCVMQSGAVNTSDDADARYILHTITLNFLKKTQQKEMWRNVVDEAEHRFCDHFQGVLLDVALAFTKNIIKGHQLYEQNETHLKKFITLTGKHNYLVNIEQSTKFESLIHIQPLYERFLLPEERANHFKSQARIAKMKSKKLTQCYYMLWRAESYFQNKEFCPISKITNKVEKLLNDIEMNYDAHNKGSLHCIRALYNYVKGRLCHDMQRFPEGLTLLNEAYSTYKQMLGPANIITIKVANSIGSVYFSMCDYREAHKVCRMEPFLYNSTRLIIIRGQATYWSECLTLAGEGGQFL